MFRLVGPSNEDREEDFHIKTRGGVSTVQLAINMLTLTPSFSLLFNPPSFSVLSPEPFLIFFFFRVASPCFCTSALSSSPSRTPSSASVQLQLKFRASKDFPGKIAMVGMSSVEDVDCGSFFDHIDDLLDFPTDDVDASLPPATSYCDSFPSIWTTHDSDFSVNCSSDLSAELSVPYEDIVQLEWLSNFMEDSFSGGGLTMNNKEDPSPQLFRTSSPVSVLESSSSCSGAEKRGPRIPEHIVPGLCGRARSKRPRPETFSSHLPTKLVSPASSGSDTPRPFLAPKVYSDFENVVVSHTLSKKRKKIKSSIPLGPVDSNQNAAPQVVRKCLHCEITKTPQWRAGPMGPKTLCNACGVRYKSGRLCPEYRPAASPTFVPSVHSNSHKKVLEMRNKLDEEVD